MDVSAGVRSCELQETRKILNAIQKACSLLKLPNPVTQLVRDRVDAHKDSCVADGFIPQQVCCCPLGGTYASHSALG